MPDQGLYEEVVKRISQLEQSLAALTVKKKKFEILNQTTVAQITADQNDYTPGDYDFLRISSDAARNITGISGGVPGRVLLLRNAGSFNITLVYNSGLSLANNRIITPGFANVVMTPFSTGTNTFLMLEYQLTQWHVMFKSAP